LADFTLESRGEYFPSLDQMKETLAVTETSTTIRERIAGINKEHAGVLDKLYEWQARQCQEEYFDTYASLDDSVRFSNVTTKRLSSPTPQTLINHAYETIRYSHFQTILPLQKKLALIKSQEAAEQRRIDSQFPMSVSEYRAIRDKQVQLRIGGFLMLEDEYPGNSSLVRVKRDQVMSKFGWAWMQVTPLCEEYSKNETFKVEVQMAVKDIGAAADPRRKRV